MEGSADNLAVACIGKIFVAVVAARSGHRFAIDATRNS